MSVLVSGAAGFIGCNLVKALLDDGKHVVAFDNLSRGRVEYLRQFGNDPHFSFSVVDLADYDQLRAGLARVHSAEPIDEAWHLAANSDIPGGVSDPAVDLRDTFMTTFNLARAMKDFGIPALAFASSSAIYGDRPGITLTESTGPCLPISNYGAMKLASEGVISAAAESHLAQAFIFRFPNVVGAPATHGVIFDFIHRLRDNPSRLDVLGNGTQQKGYLHVDDLIGAMRFIRAQSRERVTCCNIGASDEGATVRFIAEETVAAVAPGARIAFGEGDRGWVGDVPQFSLSVEKLHGMGWRPKLGSRDAIRRAIREIAAQDRP